MGIVENDSNDAHALADRAAYINFIQSLIAELDRMYKSDISREEKLIRKEEIISNTKNSFDENYDSLFITDNFRFFSELPVNNAYLELFRLYHEEDSYFKDLFERVGKDLPKFIAAAKTLRPGQKRGADPKLELEKALGLR
jgi:predicted aminopeptidase